MINLYKKFVTSYLKLNKLDEKKRNEVLNVLLNLCDGIKFGLVQEKKDALLKSIEGIIPAPNFLKPVSPEGKKTYIKRVDTPAKRRIQNEKKWLMLLYIEKDGMSIMDINNKKKKKVPLGKIDDVLIHEYFSIPDTFTITYLYYDSNLFGVPPLIKGSNYISFLDLLNQYRFMLGGKEHLGRHKIYDVDELDTFLTKNFNIKLNIFLSLC